MSKPTRPEAERGNVPIFNEEGHNNEGEKENPCLKCEYLSELYKRTPKSEKDYWIMTELFVMLHEGDVCKGGRR